MNILGIMSLICVAQGIMADCDTHLSKALFENPRLLIQGSGVVPVNVTWAIIGIEEIHEVNEHAKVFMALFIQWEDPRLGWTEAECEYDRVRVFPLTRIWFPHFTFLNAYARVADYSRFNDRFVYIYRNSTARMIYYAEEEMKCEMVMRNYPNDEHTCSIDLYFADLLKINLTDETRKRFQVDENPEWILGATSHVYNDDYVSLRYSVERKPTFIVVAVIIPAMILCPLPILPFVLPPSSGEKMGVALETLLTYFITGLAFFDRIPVSADVPLMGTWFIYLMATTSLACIMSAVVIRLAIHETTSEKDFSILCVYFTRFLRGYEITAKRVNTGCLCFFAVSNIVVPYIMVLAIMAS